MIPFTNYYGMQFNPFDKTLSSRDAFETLDMEQEAAEKVAFYKF